MHKLPCCLRPHACQARYASTSVTPYPFPSNAHPTAHQIFHLPIGASQKDIKSRYYELVRVHHPDSPHGRDLSPAIRRHRFQAITAAYDVLRGKKSAASMYGPGDIYRQEIERRRRARAAYEASRMRSEFAYEHPSGTQWTASADDRWKDRIILFVGLMALGAGLGPALVWPSYTASYQAHLTASKNLATARKEAREYGEERRREISKRVKEYKEQQAREQAERESASASASS
ncbi:hypothetical protein L226DRAFT_246718 [Lentinus tigrinus ALCF2SS1-7]|uniref:J domain-containing protein n=1 Tax=Lentinus tigrinus ALCF2SS1-6 TaxID=1328759 RepID=A0A5C2SNQ4_9APHY|nr:hypothetical protein L227DRAFT_540008 [Lentinus tigrinus ALCF2SS1-6]RPD79320.1 hypothetical protein L226DRAFT_246718 [Lentinus tigrinus ALCF2SS1-7]